MSQLGVGTRVRLAEFVRQPTTLAMLLVLPPVVIVTYGAALSSFPQLPSLGADPVTTGRLTGTLFAVAFLAGLVGLFQVISARSGDERLLLAGFDRRALLISRLVAVLLVAAGGSAVAYAVLTYFESVAAPLLAFSVLLLAGVVYGLIGAVVGTLIPRDLEGSLVLVFLADMDNALATGLVGSDLAVAEFFPLYHPHALFEAAVLEGRLASAHVLPSLTWVAGLLVVALLAYGRSTGEGGVLP